MDEITFIYKTREDLNYYEVIFNKLLIIAKNELNISQNLSLSLTFISGHESIEMNKQYRNKDYVADVISFPIDDEFNLYEQIGFREVGDIFICFEEANRKAIKMNHKIDVEMAWLFVHGLLHILGYDHDLGEKEELEMFSLTDKILEIYGVSYEME